MNLNQNVDVVPTIRPADVDHIKNKVIQLYRQYIRRLNKGYKDDYSTILNMINFVSMPRNSELDRQIFEYLINVRP